MENHIYVQKNMNESIIVLSLFRLKLRIYEFKT